MSSTCDIVIPRQYYPLSNFIQTTWDRSSSTRASRAPAPQSLTEISWAKKRLSSQLNTQPTQIVPRPATFDFEYLNPSLVWMRSSE